MLVPAFRFAATVAVLLASIAMASADLVVDSTQSSTTITIGGTSDSSQTSGTATLITSPLTEPFSAAQINNLDLVLDDGLNISLLNGFVTITSTAGDISVNMIAPGAAGAIAGGEFDQLGNLINIDGTMNVADPLGLTPDGSGPFELSSLGTQTLDFNDVQISAAGEIVTIDASYSFSDTINGFEVMIDGRVVASGTVSIPEPTGFCVLGAVMICGLVRRQRAA